MNKNNYVIAPGETILELLEIRKISKMELSKQMQENIETINQLCDGQTPITPSIAIKLEKVFNISANFWNNLEKIYQQEK